MAFLEMPLINTAEKYKFLIRLDSVRYSFSFRFNTRLAQWVMNISTASEEPLISGIPLLIGVSLVDKFKLETLPQGDLYMLNVDNENEDADRDNLGQTVILIYNEAA